MSFRRRKYPEVLHNILTGIVGGVSAEAYPFPPAESPPFEHTLKMAPVSDVVSVYGTRNGASYLFAKDVDYKLSGDQKKLVWQDAAKQPDSGSVVHVNYLPESAGSSLNDLHVGSVTRTMAESIGLEISAMYAQLEAVYKAGYINTAEGMALDHVVALLGVERVKSGRFSGEVEFYRTTGGHGEIYIPAGVRLMDQDGNVEYETTGPVTMIDGQNVARVNARDVETNSQGVEADMLTVLAKPISGISGVSNPKPTAITNNDESDDELRTRAKNFLHGSERATLGAIQHAVSRQGILAEIVEVEDAGLKTGFVEVIPHTDELSVELRQRINAAINDTRPVGVNVSLPGSITPPEKIDLKLRIVTSSQMLEQDLRAAQDTVRSSVEDYFNSLPLKEPGSVNKLIGLVMNVPEIQDVEIISPLPDASGLLGLTGKTTVLRELEIIDSNLPTLLQLVITYQEGADVPDESQIEQAMLGMVESVSGFNSGSDSTMQQLTTGMLLYALPLPGHDAGAMQADMSAVTLPATSDIPQYGVRFVFSKQSGVSQILAADGDVYELTPFERLSFMSVEVVPEPLNG